MSNKIRICTTILLSIPLSLYASSLHPTDIVGRDLSYPVLGWIGHIGIATASYIWEDATYVVETLNEPPLILQINLLKDFKKKSPYWGAKFGISNNDAQGTKIINEGAFQTSLKCAEYTLTTRWKAGTGQWGVPFTCPLFRCDTFVNYLYWWGGYTLPTYTPSGGTSSDSSLPKTVFKLFPFSRNEKSVQMKEESFHQNQTLETINNITLDKLQNISYAQFVQSVDIPDERLTQQGIDNLLKFSNDPILDSKRRLFLLDRLGFVDQPDLIPRLIEIYYKNQEDEEISHMILRDIQAICQHNNLLINHQKEKELLHQFYHNLLIANLTGIDAPIVIRGFIALSNSEEILLNQTKIDQLIADKVESSIGLTLKIGLAFKSRDLEKYYIPQIISFLETQNKSSLDILFAGAIVGKLNHDGLNSLQVKSKQQINHHLISLKSKLDLSTKNETSDIIIPQSLGICLEASALLSSTSHKEAAQYIEKYLSSIKTEDYKKYILGFSNTTYMQKAFATQPNLTNFKNSEREFYENTVGMTKH